MNESIRNKKILLVGGAGFIGHHLALSLKAHGADVAVLDGLQVNNLLYLNQTNQHIPNRELYLKMVNERLQLLKANNIPLYVQDARDYHKLSAVFNQVQPQVVVLLAAVAHANRSNKDPYTTFDHSTRTLENALDASRAGVEHFIYFSSSMVYGDFVEANVTEQSPCNPIGIYGALKYGAEKLVIAYQQVFGLNYTIVRPSALYGERCISGRVGQIFIESALAGKEIVVQGDGSDRLDFTYIDDLVAGIRCVIESKNARNDIFNLTYGESRSIADLLGIVKEHFPDIQVRYQARDKLMPKRGTLNVDKAKQLIGYEPASSIDRGFEKYINWYKEFTGVREESVV